MVVNDILQVLPNLSPAERAQIFQELCQLLDEDLVREFGPTSVERQMLNAASVHHARESDAGTPWYESFKKLKEKQQATANKQLADEK
jgi:hypothetical protein